MGEHTAIQWTDHTFNPWWGCTRVGPGCDHCYADALDRRTGGAHWGAGAPRRRTKDWSGPHRWNKHAGHFAELHGRRQRVFCASMADVFDNEVPDEWRVDLWQLIRETQGLDWQIVTKRIGNAAKMLPPDWPQAFPHVGLIATIVNQAEADRDVPKLLATPATWRGISAEPLLGPVRLDRIAHGDESDIDALSGFINYTPQHVAVPPKALGARLNWVICGGESGAGARPMHPAWARSIRDQCVAARVPFFFKQWGEFHPSTEHDPALCNVDTPEAISITGEREYRPTEQMRRIVTDSRWAGMCRVGKKRAGRLLDGYTHDDMPGSRATL